ncbi:hypothetical protein B484DRAFT_402809, partial [Ochromonadaceae sp. CCMP2298]
MGAGASVPGGEVPEVLDESLCRSIAGESFDDLLFKSSADRNGLISKQKLYNSLARRTDVFLTHDWGHEGGVDNHERVKQINRLLQEMGLKTWFDEEMMQGNIQQQMAEGIDNAQCVVVFITKRYTEKVNGDTEGDNCKLEFMHASRIKTPKRMIPVVMEVGMRNTISWGSIVSMNIGGRLYVDMSDTLDNPALLAAKAAELRNSILKTIGTQVQQFLPEVVKSIENSGARSIKPSASAPLVAPVQATASPVGALKASSADEAQLRALTLWLTGHVKLTGAAAASYASLFMQANIGSVDRLRRRLGKEEGLLVRLGVDEYDAEDICSALSDPPQTAPAGSKPHSEAAAPVAQPQPVSGGAQSAQSQAISSGDVPGIVQLLTVGTDQGKAQAAAVLELLAADADDKRIEIVAAGATQPLIAMLLIGSAEGKANAALALRSLCRNTANK